MQVDFSAAIELQHGVAGQPYASVSKDPLDESGAVEVRWLVTKL
jgi:hypothetical protein